MLRNPTHARPHRPRAPFAPALLALLVLLPIAARAAGEESEDPAWRLGHGLPLEHLQDPPLRAAEAFGPARAAATIPFGRFTSIQVNVNALGGDNVGDAANEPSLVVDPNDHNRMAIGWRQFDNVGSNFRQAGFGATANGGQTWTTGKIQPGVFRSDPVLDTDGNGNFFYNSLSSNLTASVFRSADGGATWGVPVYAYGGDKQWMTIDRDLDFFYQAWSTASNPFAPFTFNRSVDDGGSFLVPTEIPQWPVWGTLDVAPDHTLYVVGWGQGTGCTTCVARSTDAQNPAVNPTTFTTFAVDLGGTLQTGGPNPVGLLGQMWIAVDRSTGPRAGWVYVLASVRTPTDPMDVEFVRSTDHGQTWSAPVRVNDDPAGQRAFQWFGTMSVSPSGRIDAVWNDTRGSSDSTKSALYYSFSIDGGATWSANEQATPVWNSTVGWPNQQKIGDYYDTTSDDSGVDVAYAATFTGGQDVYYLRIPNTAAPTGVGGPAASRVRALDSFPNPFAGATNIRFDAPREGGNVRLAIFDLAGHRVATLVDGFRAGARQSVAWDGRGRDGTLAAPGVYLCRLEVAGTVATRKLLRVR